MSASRTDISSMRVSCSGLPPALLLTVIPGVFVDIQGERHVQSLLHVQHPSDSL